jgi:tetratricopeptide (TPR) repeat protein
MLERLGDLRATCLRGVCWLLCLGLGFVGPQPVAWSQPLPDASDCAAKPQRTCVLDLAFAAALAIDYPMTLGRDAMLQAVVAARKDAGLPAVSGPPRAAVASVLDKARDIERHRVSVQTYERIFALSSIAITQLELGLTEDAAATLAVLRQIEHPPAGHSGAGALRILGTAQAKAGLKAEAVASFEQGLQSIDAEQNQWLRARQTLLIAEAWSAALPDRPNVAFAQALRAAQEMRDDRLKAKALGSIAEAQWRAGLAEDARRTFEQALAFARSIVNMVTRNEALFELSGRLASAGMKPQAADAADDALQTALAIMPDETRLSALLMTAKAYTQQGQITKAADALSEALAPAKTTGRALAILSVARAQAAAGLPADATATLRQAPASPAAVEDSLRFMPPEYRKESAARNQDAYDSQRAGILGAIALAQARAGASTEAAQSFAEARQIARAIGNARTRAMTLAAIAEAAPAAGSSASAIADEVVASLSHALRNPRGIESDRDQTQSGFALTLVTSARGLGASGARTEEGMLLEKALRAAKEMTDPWGRYSMLRTIAEELAASGNINQAMQAVQDMKTPERVDALLAIAKELP